MLRRTDNTIAPLAIVVALTSWPAFESQAYALPCYATDSPGCTCFTGTGVWDPPSGALLSAAYPTIGTTESCVTDGGKPFYQIQLGANNPLEATLLAGVLGSNADRRPWCSETVAYWHREARLPFPGGYETAWHWSWQTPSTSELRTWYQTAELIGLPGRGRWIDSVELDLDDFRPGYNAPCPGAYQQLEGYSDGAWSGTSNAHSQVIESMTVHLNGPSSVRSFDVRLIEGNSENRIRNNNVYVDVPRFTPHGSGYIQDTRKIRGWGIDLAPDGEVLCQWENIKWAEEYLCLQCHQSRPAYAYVPSTSVDMTDEAIVAKNIEFMKRVQEQGGLLVKLNDDDARIEARPTPREPWIISLEHTPPNTQAALGVELPAPYPQTVGMIEIGFTGAQIPEAVSVVVKDPGGIKPPSWMSATAEIPEGANTGFLHFPQGVVITSFDIEFKDRAFGRASAIHISRIQLHAFVDPKDEDSPDNE